MVVVVHSKTAIRCWDREEQCIIRALSTRTLGSKGLDSGKAVSGSQKGNKKANQQESSTDHHGDNECAVVG